MNCSSRLKNILNRIPDLWDDSDTDTSSLSDNDKTNKISPNTSETSSDENSQSSTCCLICSILPNLSNINTCQKHLALLTSRQVIYMTHPVVHNCHCQSKSKHRSRSSSSSESESEFRHPRKKRSMTVQLSDTSSQSDVFFSPNVKSQDPIDHNLQHRFNHVQARLSPSLPPSSTFNTDINKHYTELLLTPFLQENTREELTHENNSPDLIEIETPLSCLPRISLNRIIHVKDDGEILNDIDKEKVMISMAEATEQMFNREFPQPIILLERISLEKIEIQIN